MSKIAVVGSGRIGLSIAHKLWKEGEKIILIDINKKSLAKAPEEYEKYVMDISNYDDIRRKFPDVDLAVTALPGKKAYKGILNLMKKGIDIVDISSYHEDMKKLEEHISKSNILYVPHAGFAPGLSNILAARLDHILNGADHIAIYVGGVSEKPDDILGITLTWSPEDLLNEYINPARIIRNNEIKYVDPFEYTGLVDIPELGEMEYFASDGLGTLLITMKHVKNMEELTLRYKGHVERMRFLKNIGILSNDYIELNNLKIQGKEILLKLLLNSISNTYKDLTVLYVVAEKDHVKKSYFVTKKYDEDLKISAMSIMTGYTAAIIAKLYLEGFIKMKGLVPPEYIGGKEESFKKLELELAKEKVSLKHF